MSSIAKGVVFDPTGIYGNAFIDELIIKKVGLTPYQDDSKWTTGIKIALKTGFRATSIISMPFSIGGTQLVLTIVEGGRSVELLIKGEPKEAAKKAAEAFAHATVGAFDLWLLGQMGASSIIPNIFAGAYVISGAVSDALGWTEKVHDQLFPPPAPLLLQDGSANENPQVLALPSSDNNSALLDKPQLPQFPSSTANLITNALTLSEHDNSLSDSEDEEDITILDANDESENSETENNYNGENTKAGKRPRSSSESDSEEVRSSKKKRVVEPESSSDELSSEIEEEESSSDGEVTVPLVRTLSASQNSMRTPHTRGDTRHRRSSSFGSISRLPREGEGSGLTRELLELRDTQAGWNNQMPKERSTPSKYASKNKDKTPFMVEQAQGLLKSKSKRKKRRKKTVTIQPMLRNR